MTLDGWMGRMKWDFIVVKIIYHINFIKNAVVHGFGYITLLTPFIIELFYPHIVSFSIILDSDRVMWSYESVLITRIGNWWLMKYVERRSPPKAGIVVPTFTYCT